MIATYKKTYENGFIANFTPVNVFAKQLAKPSIYLNDSIHDERILKQGIVFKEVH